MIGASMEVVEHHLRQHQKQCPETMIAKPMVAVDEVKNMGVFSCGACGTPLFEIWPLEDDDRPLVEILAEIGYAVIAVTDEDGEVIEVYDEEEDE